MRDDRIHALAVRRGRSLAGDAEHARLTRTVDVGIKQADARAFGRQRQRQIGGDRRLADTALAAGDRDDVADTRQWPQILSRAMAFDARAAPRLRVERWDTRCERKEGC